ncbi:hypothetical protein OB955_22970 [Halobacteria archaeon AArc-m2/3/4]|uniref:Alpha galactosidase C-terminal domain-containing protein n=1 Tax=Natronoglomus mannanivorans TaxID=2979990 RepID=A0AAP2Z377_9EURY|nr:hypothetical protein [Halobacteria archaeon AArc-xg1-1]MCU4975553.1 hypothetical protein [Halobacteria archaeon AArc-m2/3/4]
MHLPEDADSYAVTDVWSGEEWTTDGSLEATVDSHDVAFFRVGPV